jgi:hypothetical protein
MKKIICTFLIMLTLPFAAMAGGRIAEIWTQPAVFKADEPVSWFFDVTGTALEGLTTGVYMWTWYPSEPDINHWSNSSEFAALTYVEGNIWRFDLTPTEYYGVEASSIFAFYGLLKTKDGTKQTDPFAPDQDPPNDIQMYSLNTIRGSALLDYYPQEIKTDRPLSILVNAKNTWSGCETTPVKGDLANASNVHMEGGVNLWDIKVENNAANLDKTELTSLGDGVFRMDLIPVDYFNLPAGYDLNNINMVFADDTWAHIGKDAACADFMINLIDEPVPELKFFPQKISRKDILIIMRLLNESFVTSLTYTITAETVVLEGSFEGKQAEMDAYIDLATALKDLNPAPAKINVVVKDNTGRVILNTDIPLVTLQ